jgi:hypothetical protein
MYFPIPRYRSLFWSIFYVLVPFLSFTLPIQIIPDTGENNTPDTTVGKIKIKQESLKTLKSSAPMTTVFTDAVDVKIKVGKHR